MQSFNVLLTPDAEKDLRELREYIAYILQAPMTAKQYIHFLRQEIERLSYIPEGFPLVEDEPWHTRGIRRLVAKNTLVYYRIDDASQTVYVLNFIYARRDQLDALHRMSD